MQLNVIGSRLKHCPIVVSSACPSMKLQRPNLNHLLLVAASLIAFATGGRFAANAIVEKEQSRYLEELTDVALRRAEVGVDFGAATLNELAKRGPLSCDPASLQAVRLQVYQRPAVKDIRLVNRDGSVICSAYSETLEFDNGWVDRPEMLPSEDRHLLLFRVDQLSEVALGVLRDVDERKSLVAVLGINSYAFNIMPAELRAHSQVVLELNNGSEVGSFSQTLCRVLATDRLQQGFRSLPSACNDPC